MDQTEPTSKRIYATSPDAFKTQLLIATSTYAMAVIVHNTLNLPGELPSTLQICLFLETHSL